MDELLAEAFRHNAWATKQLLAFCRELDSDQLNATAPGTFGSIVATFNHIIYADAGYLPRPKITRPEWQGDEDDVVSDLGKLE
ncbi:MAG TPA: DinB family protein, partial [Candidatus Dormibacteraeota bacterium]|nr:DinB family protein [Candidatus Dormibacteraeota bacterium]